MGAEGHLAAPVKSLEKLALKGDGKRRGGVRKPEKNAASESLHWTAIAPCPTAGTQQGIFIGLNERPGNDEIPSLPRPAAESIVASAGPSATLRRRVSTLPRISVQTAFGKNFLSCARLRGLPVATSAGTSAPSFEMSTSRASSRGRKQGIERPSGESTGISFALWTAKSARPSSRASSSSFVKSPLPPCSSSDHDSFLSPVVLNSTISYSESGILAEKYATAMRACVTASGLGLVATL